MDYLNYLIKNPEVYQNFSTLLERTANLYRYLQERKLLNMGDNFFSIGAGEGELEIVLANHYQSAFEILDPVPLFIDNFKQSLMQAGPSLQLRAAHHNMPFEDYAVARAFDWVLSIHSWYGFGYDRMLLDKALSMVKPGGGLFITLMSQKSPVYGLSNMSYSSGIDLCAEKLSEWVNKEGVKHHFDWEVAERPASLFLNEYDDVTSQARDFASFLVAKPWGELSRSEQNKIRNIFLEHRRGDTVNIVSGCLTIYP